MRLLHKLSLIPAFCMALTSAASAEAPRIVADIGPVAMLARAVAGPEAELTTLIEPGVSPHGLALRPSQARALSRAGLVLWVGPELTPWLQDAQSTLAPGAVSLQLLHSPGTVILEADAHEHDEHADHAHHGDASADDHAHDHGALDPHAWLLPENAKHWAGVIASTLAEMDPANAQTYHANAARLSEEIARAEAEVAQMLTPLAGVHLVAVHDAYGYLEQGFDLPRITALMDTEALPASAARASATRDALRSGPRACLLLEPQQDPRALRNLVADPAAAASTTIDPLGATLTVEDGYARLLRDIGAALADCARG